MQNTLRLNQKVQEHGIPSLEEEVFDLDDGDFTRGLCFVIDGAAAGIIEEYFSNKISFIKDKYTRLYKTILKRAVLGIQAQEKNNILVHVLLSYAGLPQKEQRNIEYVLLSDV